MRSGKLLFHVIGVLVLATFAVSVHAQQLVYTDSLQNGWQNNSYSTTVNFSNTSPVHSGNDSISATVTSAYGALWFTHSAFNSSPYGAVSFWVNGGPDGGQQLQVDGTVNFASQGIAFPLGTVPSDGQWHQYTVPLAAIGVAGVSNMDGFWIQDVSGHNNPPPFYVDDVSLTSSALPSSVNINTDASTVLRTVSPRWLGLNTTMWDSNVGSSATQQLIGAAGFKILRWPGGSNSDFFNWTLNNDPLNDPPFTWPGNTGAYIQLLLGSGATGIISTNYGSGTPQEAAAWVAYFNGSPSSTQEIGTDVNGFNWQTVGYWASIRAATPLTHDDGYNFLRVGISGSLNIEYYEIGNEQYGSWEYDTHGASGSNLTGSPNDAVTYAEYSEQFINAMKAVDPTVHVGCVAAPGQDNYPQSTSVRNLSDGTMHSGWTAVLLATLANPATNPTGTLPDFLIDHRYPLNAPTETDAGVLATTYGWSFDASDLRYQINNYLGASKGANIELNATETNDQPGVPGKQTVSLVNALYAADSIGKISQTELNELNWWDMRNGYTPSTTSGGNFSSSIYGWRDYGDEGIISWPTAPDPANTPYPPYFAFQLASHWAIPGGNIISTSSSDPADLTAYGAMEPDGSLALMVINKNASEDFSTDISFNSFVPASTATVYSFGEANDTQTISALGNESLTISTLSNVSSSLTYTFPRYSMTVLDFPFVPQAPQSLSATGAPGQIGLSWSAPSGPTPTGYVIQRGTTPGGPYSVIQSDYTGGTSYTDTNVTSGTKYYYVVAALNNTIQGPNSNEASATPGKQPPAAPTGLTAVAGTSTIALSWTAPTGTVTATGYDVFRGTTSGGPYTILFTNQSATTATDTTPVVGTPYFYVVTALNGTLQSADSNEATATIKFPTPNAPTNLTATAGQGTVGLTWTAPTGPVTATGYNLYRSTTSGSGYSIVQSGLTITSATDNTVVNGTTYYYVVTALNKTSESADSNQATAKPNWPTPNAPTGLNATGGNATVALSWTAPVGGPTPTGYNVYRSTTSGSGYSIVDGDISATTATDNTVTNGTTYYYVVTALNHTAESADSNQVSVTPNYPAPQAPANVLATAGSNWIWLTWSAPGGTVVPTSYSIYRATQNGGPYVLIQSGLTARSAGDSNVVDGHTYYYVITAWNHTAQSPYSNQSSATASALPGPPVYLMAVASNGTATLYWDPPYGTVNSYVVQRSTSNGGPYTVLARNVTATSYANTGLKSGTVYYYVVAAVNSAGQGPNSNQASTLPPLVTPNAPTNLTAAGGNNEVTLSWSAPTNATVTSYTVLRSTSSSGPFSQIGSVTGTGDVDETVTNGTLYYYVVDAVNGAGTSTYSNVASATPSMVLPNAPTNLSAVGGSGEVTLSWNAPTNTTPTSYNVKRQASGGGSYVTIANVTGTTFTNSGLASGTTYSYEVSALDAAGEGPNSSPASATTTSNKGFHF